MVQTAARKSGLKKLGQFGYGAAGGALLALLLIVAPIYGIRRAMPLSTWPWPELSAVAVLAVAAAMMIGRICCADAQVRTVMLGQNLELSSHFAAAAQDATVPKLKLRLWAKISRHLSLIGALLFLFLYCSAIALCQRMFVGTLQSGAVDLCRAAGLLIVIAGCALQVKAVLFAFAAPVHDDEPTRFCSVFRIRHPVLLGWLIVMCGLPLAFGTWLPLLAIPGSIVALRWQIKLWEESLEKQFGERYTRFRSRTWRLLPFIGG
ncbi:MAG: methyltransferase family protein [Terriglobales bacterium]